MTDIKQIAINYDEAKEKFIKDCEEHDSGIRYLLDEIQEAVALDEIDRARLQLELMHQDVAAFTHCLETFGKTADECGRRRARILMAEHNARQQRISNFKTKLQEVKDIQARKESE